MSCIFRFILPGSQVFFQFDSICTMENYSSRDIINANRRIAAYNASIFNFEEDLRFLVAIRLLHCSKKRRSPYKMFKQRSQEGAHNLLIDRHLFDDDTKFKEYFRMSPYIFNEILDAIKEDIQGVPTTWVPQPISPHDKLCITLRLLHCHSIVFI